MPARFELEALILILEKTRRGTHRRKITENTSMRRGTNPLRGMPSGGYTGGHQSLTETQFPEEVRSTLSMPSQDLVMFQICMEKQHSKRRRQAILHPACGAGKGRNLANPNATVYPTFKFYLESATKQTFCIGGGGTFSKPSGSWTSLRQSRTEFDRPRLCHKSRM